MNSPRILVTGFGVFPGAPVNPTEALVVRLARHPPRIDVAFRAEVLPVEYATVADRLSAICRDFSPDIAIHFGLAREARGFRLERLARNSHAAVRPDQAGGLPAFASVCEGPETLPATLPLELIADGLEVAGLPVQWSDDAGGYLCNVVMMLSLAHACEGLRPAMSGFVHVPPLPNDAGKGEGAMTAEDLERGARIIIARCIDAWRRGQSAAKRD